MAVADATGNTLGSPALDLRGVRRVASGWANRPLRDRLAMVRRFRRALAREAEVLVGTLPVGRSEAETLAGEIIPLADACRFLEREGRQVLRPVRLGRRGRPRWLFRSRVELHREPVGVVLIIGASNYPLFLPGVQLLQALVAGNGVVLKPGRGGSKAARELARLAVEAGAAPDLVLVAREDPESVQEALQGGVDKVLLTGSAETGRKVASMLAERLIPATLELSGCDAVFVRPEADLDLVTKALRFGLGFNDAATCIGPRRVFVPRPLARQLEARLVDALGSLPPVRVGRQVAARVRGLLNEAVAQGARLAHSPGNDDLMLRPALLAGVTPTMSITAADLFAPVLSLLPVESDEDAVAQSELCPYALGATVFGDEAPARDLARRVRAGVVVVNDMIVPTADPRIPFGGRGTSGYGVTRGADGLRELTVVKSIAIRGGRWRPHLDELQAGSGALFSAWLRSAHGGTVGERLRGIWNLIAAASARKNNGSEEKKR